MTQTSRSLKVNEQKILGLLLENKGYSFKEIAKLVGLNEVSVRRIHNRLKQEEIFTTLNIPNFPVLGYKILMVQKIHVSSPFLISTKKLIDSFMHEWDNCIDCHETYDGKIIVRSVWRNADCFKLAHTDFFRTHGTDWLDTEDIDMIPLDDDSEILRIKSMA
ncbi:winged helix-turn-helix transcriptional regulator [Nanoarchaeota archaeon]